MRKAYSLSGNSQQGAALVIVLMLVATLSFIVLSLSQMTALSVQRASHIGARHELYWRAIGAEQLAASTLKALFAEENVRLTDEAPLFTATHVLPLEDGAGTIEFADRTSCFNVNSVTAGEKEEDREQTQTEFLALAKSLNIGAGEAQTILASLIDWIDDDRDAVPGGAEDRIYTALPAPYRTGGRAIADTTEMRAMKGVTAELYGVLAPYLCARSGNVATTVNVNMLTPEQAPILVSLLNGKVSLVESLSIISARPPGGYGTVEQFWQTVSAKVDLKKEDMEGRFAVLPSFIEARVSLELGDSEIVMRSLFDLDENGETVLVSRSFGDG